MPARAGSFFRRYFPFTLSSFYDMFAYKGAFFLYSMGTTLRSIIMLFLWKAVFSNNPNAVIAGFTMEEMIVYVFLSDIVSRTVYNGIDEFIFYEIKDGSIAINLVRPISFHWRMFFLAVGTALTDFLFAGLPIWIGLTLVLYFTTGAGLPSVLNLMMFFVSFGLSFLLMFFFNLCFGFLGFITTNGWGLSHTKYTLVNILSGRLIPLSFFPLWAQEIFKYLPFGSMTYTTLLIYLGKLTPLQALGTMGIQLAWAAGFAVLSILIWRLSVKRLTILGG